MSMSRNTRSRSGRVRISLSPSRALSACATISISSKNDSRRTSSKRASSSSSTIATLILSMGCCTEGLFRNEQRGDHLRALLGHLQEIFPAIQQPQSFVAVGQADAEAARATVQLAVVSYLDSQSIGFALDQELQHTAARQPADAVAHGVLHHGLHQQRRQANEQRALVDLL